MFRRIGVRLGVTVTGVVVGGAVWAVVDPGIRREVIFWKTALPIVVSYKYTEWKFDKDEALQQEQYELLHQQYAPVLLDLFSRLGGLFIKIGQVLSARPELVPKTYRDQLRKLQSHVTGQPFEAIREVVEEELGGKIETKFAFFDPKPLGAASIGQAHRATTLQGEEVVVKVQYPDVGWQFRADIRSAELFVHLFARYVLPLMDELRRQALEELDYVQEGRNITDVYNGLMPTYGHKVAVPQLMASLCSSRVLTMTYLAGPKLEEEALRQLKLVGVSFEEGIRERILSVGGVADLATKTNSVTTTAPTATSGTPLIPSRPFSFLMYAASFAPIRWLGLHGYLYYTRITLWFRSRELTSLLWFAENFLRIGIGGDKLKTWVERNLTEAQRLRSLQNTKAWIDTLLAVHGFEIFKMQPSLFNADPHPGNILMMPDGRLGLIDYGQCRRVPEEGRNSLAQLMVAVADAQDDASLAQAMRRAGCKTQKDNDRFLAVFARLMFDRIDARTLDVKFLWELRNLDSEPVMPPDLLLAARAAALLRGTSFALGHNISVASHWRPFAVELLTSASKS